MALKQNLMKHSLFHTLLALERNAKICVLTEPMFTIPFNLIAPFVTLYMHVLGLDDGLIGSILSIGMVLQVAATLMGGVLTDKLGRRKTTFIFDMLSWSVPCILWAFAQNFWWFMAAAVFNAMSQISNISFGLLLAEDTDKAKLVNVYSWIQITGLLAAFFAPISSYIVGKFDLVILMRALYLIFFLTLTVKIFILYLLGKETRQGDIRLRETHNVPVSSLLNGYKDVFKMILSSRSTLLVLGFMALTNISSLAIGNFFGLYATENLQVSDSLIPIFPMVRAAFMLVIMFSLQGRFNRMPLRAVLIAGLCIYIISHLLLVFAQAKNLYMLFGYILMEGLAFSIIQPRKDSMLIWFVDEQQRARINALIYVIMIAISSPFGAIIGLLSGINRLLPFIFNIVMFLAGILMIAASRTLKKTRTTEAETAANKM